MNRSEQLFCSMPVPPKTPDAEIADAGTIVIVEITEDVLPQITPDIRPEVKAFLTGKSAVLTAAHISEIQQKVGLLGRGYIKHHKGKSYLILKGLAGKRALAGTRYLISNATVARLVMAPRALMGPVIKGAKLDLIITVGADVANFFLKDDAMMSDLVGKVAASGVKAVITTAAGWLTAIGVAAVSTSLVLPVVAAFAVGLGAAMLADHVDEKYGLTDKLVTEIEQVSKAVAERKASTMRKAARSYGRFEQEFIHYMMNRR